MKNFLLIGDPVKQSLGPVLHGELFRQLSIEARYNLKLLKREQLPEMMQDIRSGVIAGANVTIPLKTDIIPYLDELSDVARAVGAVNCLSYTNGHLIGHNTDVDGIEFALNGAHFDASGQSVLVLGSGGAARAAIHYCREKQVKLLGIAARNIDQAKALADSPGDKISVRPLELDGSLETTDYDLVIQATPVGMWPQTEPSPIQQSQIHGHQVIFDMVYNPPQTRLLQLAHKQGCQVIQGLDMFIGQGIASLSAWFDGNLGEAVELHKRLDMTALKSALYRALEEQFPSTTLIQDKQ